MRVATCPEGTTHFAIQHPASSIQPWNKTPPSLDLALTLSLHITSQSSFGTHLTSHHSFHSVFLFETRDSLCPLHLSIFFSLALALVICICTQSQYTHYNTTLCLPTQAEYRFVSSHDIRNTCPSVVQLLERASRVTRRKRQDRLSLHFLPPA